MSDLVELINLKRIVIPEYQDRIAELEAEVARLKDALTLEELERKTILAHPGVNEAIQVALETATLQVRLNGYLSQALQETADG